MWELAEYDWDQRTGLATFVYERLTGAIDEETDEPIVERRTEYKEQRQWMFGGS